MDLAGDEKGERRESIEGEDREGDELSADLGSGWDRESRSCELCWLWWWLW